MRLPFVRRSRHESDVARERERASDARQRTQGAKEQAARAKAAARESRIELERVRAQLREAERATQAAPRLAEGDRSVREQIQGHRDLRPLLAMRLAGEGIEIGALHRPLPVSPGVVVRYVDRRTREENTANFPDLPARDIVETNYLCDGQTLSAIPDESQDFVIANHMLEHCVNPLRALENFLRVLKPLGRLFLSLPDKRFTFDLTRPVTDWMHVLNDYRIQREVEDRAVYEEYRQCVDARLDPDAAVAGRREIHHHAWTQGEILELFIKAKRDLGWPLEIEYFAKQGCEVVLVIQKADPPHEDHAKLYERMADKARRNEKADP